MFLLHKIEQTLHNNLLVYIAIWITYHDSPPHPCPYLEEAIHHQEVAWSHQSAAETRWRPGGWTQQTEVFPRTRAAWGTQDSWRKQGGHRGGQCWAHRSHKLSQVSDCRQFVSKGPRSRRMLRISAHQPRCVATRRHFVETRPVTKKEKEEYYVQGCIATE